MSALPGDFLIVNHTGMETIYLLKINTNGHYQPCNALSQASLVLQTSSQTFLQAIVDVTNTSSTNNAAFFDNDWTKIT